MITKVRFPKIDANIEEATLTRWVRQEGEALKKGDILAELTTDKGVVEIEAPHGGTLRQTLATINSVLPVGYILALIGDADEALPDVAEANRALIAKHRAAAGRNVATPAGAARSAGAVVRATPAARRLAREKGLDLAEIQKATGAEIIQETVIQDYLRSKGA